MDVCNKSLSLPTRPREAVTDVGRTPADADATDGLDDRRPDQDPLQVCESVLDQCLDALINIWVQVCGAQDRQICTALALRRLVPLRMDEACANAQLPDSLLPATIGSPRYFAVRRQPLVGRDRTRRPEAGKGGRRLLPCRPCCSRPATRCQGGQLRELAPLPVDVPRALQRCAPKLLLQRIQFLLVMHAPCGQDLPDIERQRP
mmetsp:Transcript_32285/g.70496  ORF Transcript_32285/g.70496 Transcript_32285/m.70496 type:complete len:204 (+) Transcript_32285:79-690(+)